jgi:NTE family protein
MTDRFACCVALALAVTLTAGNAGAQSDTPRIGLALSGGGARGIAHVGVLKVLDEMRIPISCVTGTSMGSIVGGTFAAGRTPAEMEKLVLETDWNEVFRDKPPRKEIAIRRKVDDYKTLFAPELGITDNGAALPKGVLAGVAIESYFRTLATPAFGVTDFTKLPIPFRAVATDIETGQEVVLDHGNLAEAMRASMSVPGAMTPVQIDGRLLVDGGIANNLPIDLARKLCNADVIIAVNISTPPLKRSEITSALSVVGQLVNFLGKQSVDDQLKSLGEKDVLIAPDLGDISAGTFERSKDAIKVGEDATRAMAGKLARYSVPPEQYAALRSTQIREAKALGTVDEIRVEGLVRTNPAVVRELIESKPGEPLSEEKLGADLRRVFGTRDYETINYRIVGGELGPRALVIQPTEKAWGPNYLRFGLGIASDNHGNNQFNALMQYRKTWLNSLGGELLFEGQVGQDTHLFGEFFQPLTESGNWFVAPNALVGRQTRGVFVGDDQVAEYMIDVAQAGLDFGRVLGTWGQLRVGAVWSHVDAKVDVGSPILPSLEQTTAGPRVALFVDQQDRAYFPSEGYTFLGTAYAGSKSFGSAVNYQKVEGSLRMAYSLGPHTLNVMAGGGSSLGSSMPAYESFALGGPLRLSGYEINQFSGQEYAFGRVMYYRRIFGLPDLLGSGVYLGGSAEVGNIRDRVDGLPSPGTLWSASVFLGADTLLGPAYLGVGYGGGSHWSAYLLLGAP